MLSRQHHRLSRRFRLANRALGRRILIEQLEDRRLLAVYAGSGGSIADNGQTLFTLNVTDSAIIGDLNVQIDIDHNRDADLDLFLEGPDGTRVELFTDVGGGGDDFAGTILDDEATDSITSGAAPFFGSYRPEGALSAFDGLDAQGDWILDITDDRSRRAGSLNGWSIEIETAGPPQLSVADVSISEGSQLETFVTTGSGGLQSPIGGVFGPDGHLYVASRNSDQVLRYDGSSGALIDQYVGAGSGGLDGPQSLLFDAAGDLYVTSGGAGQAGQVLKYQGPASASPGTFIGEFVSSTDNGGLAKPHGMVLAASPDSQGEQNLYVVSRGTGEVLRYNASTGSFLGTYVTAGSGGLAHPVSVAFGSDGSLFVSDRDTDRVLRYQGPGDAMPGAFMEVYVTGGASGIDGPHDIIFGPDGYLYVSSGGTQGVGERVLRYEGPAGNSPGAPAGILATDEQGLVAPRGLSFDAAGNLYIVSSSSSSQVYRYANKATVSLSAASDVLVTVDYVTADGTAIAGSDYAAASGTLAFAPGETTKYVLLIASDDTAEEPNETFHLSLSNATGGATTTGQAAVVTIVDNDATAASTMHIANLDATSTPASRGKWDATIAVTVMDSSDNAVSGATVHFVWSDGEIGSVTTGENGIAIIERFNINKKTQGLTLTITNLEHTMLSYDEGQNTDPDGDSDGTIITVNKP